jgi:two-component system alkaline phosphatase synthesis response regulator PhoP
MDGLARILLIEDNQNIALTEKIALEAANYEVTVAEDGILGLERALKLSPHLILLDMLIPKMNGYLFLEAWQNNPVISNIPILVTSAKAQVDDLKQAFAYRIAGYLVKPFLPKELLEKVNEILHKERVENTND